MPAVALDIVVFGIQQLLKYAPELIEKLRLVFQGEVTEERLVALREEINSTSYAQLVPNTQLPHPE